MTDDDAITVVIGGDFCPTGRPERAYLGGLLTADAIVGTLRPLFTGSDIGIANLECPLTQRGTPIAKAGPHVRAHPDMIRVFAHMGVTCATLANNHILDYGGAGVLDTIDSCAKNGIQTVGAGATSGIARQALYLTAKGRRVALINAAEEESCRSGDDCASINPLDLINLLCDIQQAKKRADHVLLILHGGMEMTHCPSPESVRLLRFLAEQGVCAVVRHHAHFVQGYEEWRGVPILYGLGNILFDQGMGLGAGWCEGAIARLRIAPDNQCRVELHPIRQCDAMASATPLDGATRQRALDAIESYNALLADPLALANAWSQVLERMRADYYGRLLLPTRWGYRIAARLGVVRFLRPTRRAVALWANLLRCPAHREALVSVLDREYMDVTARDRSSTEE